MGHGCSARYDDTHRGFVAHAQKYGVLLAICVGIWALTGFIGVWPMWVAVICGVKLAMHAVRVYRDSDGDADGEPVDETAPEDDFVIV